MRTDYNFKCISSLIRKGYKITDVDYIFYSQVDEDLIQHDVIMTWLDDAQQQLNEVRKRHKYRQQDYLDFRSFKSELDQKQAEVCTCVCVRVHLVLKFSNVRNHVNECGFKAGQVNTAAAMFESCFAF